MMPPTSIDGTDITGATIDGQDVQEITVDGQTVFTAGPTLPVAYTDLVAWWPFDSAEYGGSNADDVTAIIGGSGDDTAFDGTIGGGVSYQSSGGVIDINAEQNSGAFDFGGSDPDEIEISNSPQLDGFSDITIMAWTNVDDFNNSGAGRNFIVSKYFDGSNRSYRFIWQSDQLNCLLATDQQNANNQITTSSLGILNKWQHVAMTWSASTNTITAYVDGQAEGTATSTGNTVRQNNSDVYIGNYGDLNSDGFDGKIDDVRIYNATLTQPQIDDIYTNTDPN